MAHESFLGGGKKVYSGSLHADKRDPEQCFQDLLKKKRGPFLTEINLVYLNEQKLQAIKCGKNILIC